MSPQRRESPSWPTNAPGSGSAGLALRLESADEFGHLGNGGQQIVMGADPPGTPEALVSEYAIPCRMDPFSPLDTMYGHIWIDTGWLGRYDNFPGRRRFMQSHTSQKSPPLLLRSTRTSQPPWRGMRVHANRHRAAQRPRLLPDEYYRSAAAAWTRIISPVGGGLVLSSLCHRRRQPEHVAHTTQLQKRLAAQPGIPGRALWVEAKI